MTSGQISLLTNIKSWSGVWAPLCFTDAAVQPALLLVDSQLAQRTTLNSPRLNHLLVTDSHMTLFLWNTSLVLPITF